MGKKQADIGRKHILNINIASGLLVEQGTELKPGYPAVSSYPSTQGRVKHVSQEISSKQHLGVDLQDCLQRASTAWVNQLPNPEHYNQPTEVIRHSVQSHRLRSNSTWV